MLVVNVVGRSVVTFAPGLLAGFQELLDVPLIRSLDDMISVLRLTVPPSKIFR